MRIIVTGATSGIGNEVAKALVRRGARVLATGRRQDRLLALQQELSSNGFAGAKPLEFLAGDLTDREFRKRLVEYAGETMKGLDGVVNNAGVGAIGPFGESSSTRLRTIFELNVFATMELTRDCLPWLSGGRKPFVAVVGSVLGHRGVPGKSEYCAAKFALRGWSESLRCELKSKGIDVILISPSTTRSEFWEALIETQPTVQAHSFGSQSSEVVAGEVVRAIERGQRERILSLGGKMLVAASKFLPGWVDRFAK